MKINTKSALLSFSVLFACLFSYSLDAFSKTIIISDIDDTLKKANSVGKFPMEAYHFLKKVPYLEMRDLFNEIESNEQSKSEQVAFYYVSAAQKFTFNAQKWLLHYNFPPGQSVLRTLKKRNSTYDFKHAAIKKILEAEIKTLDQSSNEPLHVMMFGDNSQADAVVYNDLTNEMNLDSKIYIRDVKAEATRFDSSIPVLKIPGVIYYFSEVELFQNPEFDYLSADLKHRTYRSYLNKELIPQYTFKTLYRRLNTFYHDKNRSQEDAVKFWDEYYSRF